ncbi:MAG: cysteinyl-tRNA synthetase, partial [Ardenticatenaceae bacterium]
MKEPGLVILIGSGERAPSGRKVFDWLFEQSWQPSGVKVTPKVAILETPAGFELNSDDVAGQIAEFLHKRLQNYSPEITVIPARKRGTPFSPDNP